MLFTKNNLFVPLLITNLKNSDNWIGDLSTFNTYFFMYLIVLTFCLYQDSAEENGLIKGRQDFNAFILLPPALCDMIGTSLMYIGLNLTNPSSFQMLRGKIFRK